MKSQRLVVQLHCVATFAFEESLPMFPFVSVWPAGEDVAAAAFTNKSTQISKCTLDVVNHT